MNKIEAAKDLEDIKKITSITVKKVCTQLNVNEKNLYNLKTTKENIKKVKDTLMHELMFTIEDIKKEGNK